jgi:hypothetical protein
VSPALRRIRKEAELVKEARDSAAELASIISSCVNRYARESAAGQHAYNPLYLYYRPSTATESGALRIGATAETGEELAHPERLSLWTGLQHLPGWVRSRARCLPILRGGAA